MNGANRNKRFMLIVDNNVNDRFQTGSAGDHEIPF